MSRLRAALFDVGGTLRPDGWLPPTDEDEVARLEILMTELSLSNEGAVQLVEDLRLGAMKAVPNEALPTGEAQRTAEVIIASLARIGRQGEEAQEIVRRAMGLLTVEESTFFPGALDLLRMTHERGLRNVIVSNTFWKDGASSALDFERMGIPELVDDYITSLDVGFRKPNAAMFDGALALAECDATECVFLGNVEELDIIPASERGMRTIRVCIEETAPERSRADAVVTSLADATEILGGWIDWQNE
ncbi:MAG: HAD family hydrolase [Actinomycetota bacterium]